MKKILLIGNSYHKQVVTYPVPDSYKLKSEYNSTLDKFPIIQTQDLPGGIQLLKHFIESAGNTVNVIATDYTDYGNLQLEKKKILISYLKEGKQKGEFQIEKVLGVVDAEINNSDQQNSNTEKDEKDFDLVVISGVKQDAGKTIRGLKEVFKNVKENCFVILDLQQGINSDEFLGLFATKCPQQTVAIISADWLRENGIRISKGLSWDKTLEETLDAINQHTLLEKLKTFHSVIIKFSCEAILHVYRKSDNTIHSRFYFIPDYTEEQIHSDTHFATGLNEAFLATIVNKLAFPNNHNIVQPVEEIISKAIMQGMKAAISFNQNGFCYNENDRTISYPVEKIFADTPINIKVIDSTNYAKEFPQNSILNHLAFKDQALIHINAALYVKTGKTFLFDCVPYAQINNLKTYVKNEMEDFRSIKASIDQHIALGGLTIPISFAVFGSPGSGKSFGVKQIAKSLFSEPRILEFNLSQFQSYNDLVKAFHIIRDECLKGKIPFVFFDEFDSALENNNMGWLKYFLKPMEQGLFKEGESEHPIGKSIFVFAGGTCSSFDEFEKRANMATEKDNDPRKMTDFISRLKSYINIQGIDQRNEMDAFYPLRRAIVLRNMLMDFHGLKKNNGSLNIDDNLLGALLEIPKFKHGARSLETIIKQSNLENAKAFTKSNLPAQKILELHLNTDQFEKYMEQNYLPQDAIEKIAEMIHNNWWEGEIKKDSNKPGMKPWTELTEEYKDSNRQQAIDMVRKLKAYGYSITPFDKNKKEITTFTNDEIEHMAEMEHERWMNEKISNGWTYGTPRTDELKIHDCLLPWNELDEPTKDNDRNPVKNIPGLLRSVGFSLKNQ